MNCADLSAKVKEVNQYIKDTRGYLHENPELSSKEFNTSKFLQEEAKKCNLPIQLVRGTGFLAILDTGKPGKTLVLRADIDALPIKENELNLVQHKKWVSKNEGVCHACGHDGHMAMLLGEMKILCSMKDELTGKIIFAFEEGEEAGLGIAAMKEALAPFHVDAVYGAHLVPFMKTGEMCIDAGPMMAGVAVVDFNVLGMGGHGSRPDLAINPIFAAAQVLSNIATAWCNQLDVSKTVTLGLTQIHGGVLNNIISDTCYIGGTLRFFDSEEGKKALEVIKKVADHTAQAHNCTVSFTEAMKFVSDPVINDKALAEFAQQSISELLPQTLKHGVTWYASESFAQYSSIAPSVFAFVGTGNEALGSGAGNHNDRFDLDDNSLQYGAAAATKFAIDFLNK